MKTKSIVFTLAYLLLLYGLAVSAMACCDPPCGECYECIDEECVWVGCDPPCGPCHDCNAITCECDNQCDPDNCETCVDGSCKVCGGDPNLICCDDGSCARPCEQGDNPCDSNDNSDCWKCRNLPFLCNNWNKVVYTDNDAGFCSWGCPGDCHLVDEEVECYTVYTCHDKVDYLAICELVEVEPGILEDDCVAGAPWDCYECVTTPGDEGETFTAEYWSCD